MEESGFYTAVGFILALLFAAVMGLCIAAVLYTDFAASGGIVNDRERVTLRIVAVAAASAGLIAWWTQKFAAHRGYAIRLIYGLLIYMLIFSALGGLFQFGHSLVASPGGIDFSPSGLYFSSLGAFYTFAISLVGEAILALVGLFIAAGIILATVGPKKIY